MEKPIVQNPSQVRRIIEMAESRGKKLAIEHLERFNPVVIRAKKVFETLDLGKILSFSGVRVGQMPSNPTTDILLDLGIHDFDLLSYLTGDEIHKVEGFKRKRFGKYDDWFSLIGTTRVGAVFEYHTDWWSFSPQRQIKILGEKGELFLDLFEKKLVFSKKGRPNGEEITVGKKVNALEEEIKAFIDSVIKNTPVSVSGEDGLRALELYELCIENTRSL